MPKVRADPLSDDRCPLRPQSLRRPCFPESCHLAPPRNTAWLGGSSWLVGEQGLVGEWGRVVVEGDVDRVQEGLAGA